MPTTIYFSGSISGGREDVETYRTIVAALEAAEHRVLAGAVTAHHVGAGGEALSACEIFDRDVAWIEEAARDGGVLVAEVSRPSTGVGYEIAFARHRLDMPVVCLYRPAFTRRCSGMIAGDRSIRLIEYTDGTVSAAIAQLLALLANKAAAGVV
ncbi:MAG TPA: nucleoside 2-deoxyribosyltransferase [Thermoanaerobaculia bacterium]|nr:nucleoside 2-deoxyribosyltransferase [Thermoanaerobaculia bacterium]